MVDLQTVGVLVTAASVTIAAIYYMFTLRINMKTQQLAAKSQEQTLETRQTQLFMQVVDKMDQKWTDDFFEVLEKWEWKDFNDFEKKYGGFSHPKLTHVFGALEHVGILVHEGLLNPRLLWYWQGSFPTSLWFKYKPIILELRARYEKPPKGQFGEYVEELALSMIKERDADLADFARRQESRRLAWESFGKASSFQ